MMIYLFIKVAGILAFGRNINTTPSIVRATLWEWHIAIGTVPSFNSNIGCFFRYDQASKIIVYACINDTRPSVCL